MGSLGKVIAIPAKVSRRLCNSSTKDLALLFPCCCFPFVYVIARRNRHDAVGGCDLLLNLLFKCLHTDVLPEKLKVLHLVRPLNFLEQRGRISSAVISTTSSPDSVVLQTFGHCDTGLSSPVDVSMSSTSIWSISTRRFRTYVAFMPTRSLRCDLSSAILDCTSGFDRFSDAVRLAVFALYPARIAACVAFKSMRYSRQNISCLSVSAIFISVERSAHVWDWYR